MDRDGELTAPWQQTLIASVPLTCAGGVSEVYYRHASLLMTNSRRETIPSGPIFSTRPSGTGNGGARHPQRDCDVPEGLPLSPQLSDARPGRGSAISTACPWLTCHAQGGPR